MTTTRQDAWTQDEDLLLAEVVLRSIREGGTQLQAFEEVGKKLSRTAAACGFRWNSTIRKQYKTGIELAKKQRKEIKKSSELEPKEQEYTIESSFIPNKETEGPSQMVEKEIVFEEILSFFEQTICTIARVKRV